MNPGRFFQRVSPRRPRPLGGAGLTPAALVAVAGFVFQTAHALSEREAVFKALERNAGIQLTRIRTSGDSLALESARAAWQPNVTVAAGQSVRPLDTSSTTKVVSGLSDSLTAAQAFQSRSSSSRSAASSLSIEARQPLPGGAVLSGSISGGRGVDMDSSQVGYESDARLSITQPLLRGAGRHSSPTYEIRVKSLAHEEATLREQADIIGAISDVREKYWDVYEKRILTSIYEAQREHARKQLEATRVRFSIGKAAELDTLSAALDMLRASQSVLSNSADAAIALRALNSSLGVDSAAFNVDTARDIAIASLPPADTLLAMAERFDPELRIFETARKRLGVTRDFHHNQLLPRIDLHASVGRSTTGNTAFGAQGSYNANAVIELIASYEFPPTKRKLDLERAELSLEQSKLEKQEYRRTLLLSVEQLVQTWEKERQALAISRETRRIAERRLEAARAGYELGTQNWLALSESQTDYLHAATEAVRQEITMKRLEIVFDEITGTVFDRFGIEVQ